VNCPGPFESLVWGVVFPAESLLDELPHDDAASATLVATRAPKIE
jgi:hypothetical protein